MTSTAVLAQADLVANWLGVAGQWASALATVFVAFKLDQWQRRRDTAERREREMAQARLAVITRDYLSYSPDPLWVTITNHSEQQIRQPQIKSMGDAQPPVRWAGQIRLFDEEGEQYWLQECQEAAMILPHESIRVPYQHYDPKDDRTVLDSFFHTRITRAVHVDDVTITFDMFGSRWRRTGNRDPVRSAEPAPAQRERSHSLRARVGPFVAGWVSRIPRRAPRR